MHAEIAECISSPPCLDDSKAEPSLSKEPFEQLKAELAVLRTLIVDQAQWEGMRELLLIPCPKSCLNKVWLVLAEGTAGVQPLLPGAGNPSELIILPAMNMYILMSDLLPCLIWGLSL